MNRSNTFQIERFKIRCDCIVGFGYRDFGDHLDIILILLTSEKKFSAIPKDRAQRYLRLLNELLDE